MKKLVMIVLTLLCITVFTACQFSGDTVNRTKLISGNTPQYDKSFITVGFIQTGRESGWREANTNDFKNTFTKENGYNLIYINGNSSSDRQVKAMYDLINQKVDYIILDPIIEDGWEEVINKANSASIPVIVTDRRVNADNSLYTCWIGSDFEAEGRKAGYWLDEYLNKIGRSNEKINIVILEGTKGSSASIGRTVGFKKVFSTHPNWNIVTSECANFTQGEGQTVMSEILDKYKDIDVLISQNDNMMFGAMKAMNMKEVSYGIGGGIITISFDALNEAFEKMIEGKLLASVECNPLLANLTNNIIKELQKGHKVDKINYSEESIFTYENAAYFLKDRKY